MRLLAFDTAGPVVGVAASDGDRVVERALRVARGTEAALPTLVTEALGDLGLDLADLEGVVVADGPGAFTGLRVGMAAATGFATALGLRVVPVGSLTGRALAAGLDDDVLVAMLDARKGRVYAAAWRGSDPWFGPDDIAVDEVVARLDGARFRATGEGAVVFRAAVERAGGQVLAAAVSCGVGALVREGARRWALDARDPAEIVPRYVRLPDAAAP